MDEFQDDINSEGILAGDKSKMSKWKKQLIIGGVILGFIILLIIIIVVVSSSGSDDKKEEEHNGGKEEEEQKEEESGKEEESHKEEEESHREEEHGKDDDKKVLTGQINCVYDIEDTSTEIRILGDKFISNTNVKIEIDGVQIYYSRRYKFPRRGEINVVFNIYGPINGDYMFKDVSAVKSISMKSEKSEKFTSMVSTFENCENLKSINIEGFNFDSVKSMKRLFN